MWGAHNRRGGNFDSSPAAQPAVAVDPVTLAIYVVWSDTRNGNAELYLRMFDSIQQPGWGDEIRLTDMAGNSTRPSIHSEGPLPEDVVTDVVYVAFEHVWRGHAVVDLSLLHVQSCSLWFFPQQADSPQSRNRGDR